MTRKKAFLILMFLWFSSVIAYIICGEYRLNSGKTADLKIIAHKETSLFKNGKTLFSYEINEIRNGQKIFDENLREIQKSSLKNGQTVFVSLIQNGNYFQSSDIYLSPPKNLFFIRGKVEISGIFFNLFFASHSIVYGIEDFSLLQDNADIVPGKSEIYASVKINFYGSPSLKSITADENKTVFDGTK
ncbi:MAG: hypothetical protein LBH29_01465 [Elusimicrobiota bacterium]|jgi:hypothetical protein|nr:hypothetical protein [Elusimicrobiota bacterium]